MFSLWYAFPTFLTMKAICSLSYRVLLAEPSWLLTVLELVRYCVSGDVFLFHLFYTCLSFAYLAYLVITHSCFHEGNFICNWNFIFSYSGNKSNPGPLYLLSLMNAVTDTEQIALPLHWRSSGQQWEPDTVLRSPRLKSLQYVWMEKQIQSLKIVYYYIKFMLCVLKIIHLGKGKIKYNHSQNLCSDLQDT